MASGISSLVKNVKEGKVGAAILDGVGVVADAAALVMPLVPGGVGAAIKGVRAADKGIDMARIERILATHMPEQLKRGRITESLFLAEKGFTKNTKIITTFAKGKQVEVIPDILDIKKGVLGEIKDVKELRITSQIEGEMEAAKKMNLKFHIYVEESTVVPEGVRGRIEKAGGEVLTFNRKEEEKASGLGFWDTFYPIPKVMAKMMTQM